MTARLRNYDGGRPGDPDAPAQAHVRPTVTRAERDAFDRAVRAVVDDPSLHRFVYQPIVDLARGTVAGYEMLSRFDGAQASPDRWFAVADGLGLGATLQVRVLRHGVEQLARLPADTFLTINLDPKFITRDEVVDAIEGVGSLARLVLELTEQTVSDDPAAMLALLERARSAGATVALDDVGAGYAGLQTLLAVRPQLVKLDRSLVQHIDGDPARRALAEMLGEFVGRLDGWVLAEGIETLSELRAVIDLGVPLGQGFALDRPGPGFVTELDAEPRQVIVNRAGARTFVDTLAPLVETAPVVSSADDARAAMLAEPGLSYLVLVEGDGARPVGLMPRAHALRGLPPIAPLLLSRMSEPAVSVARRAMTRDADRRFDPVVCRDGQGNYQGIVTIDRLMGRLADACDKD